MANNPVTGLGTKFHRWDATLSQWVEIAQITNISGPTKSKENIDVTALDSTGGYRKFIGSFRDGGDVSLTMNFTYEGYKMMDDDFNNECSVDYGIELNDGAAACGGAAGDNTVFRFKGLVTELPLTIATDSAITADITIKVDGEVILSQGWTSSPPAAP